MATALDRIEVEMSDERISAHARLLSKQMQALSESLFAPDSRKRLRSFTSGEAAKLLSVSDGYLRQLSLDGIGPLPDISANGRRSYTLTQINELRSHIAVARSTEDVGNTSP